MVRVGEVTAEVDVLLESNYGSGVFRIGWGIRVPGVPEVAELEEGKGTQNATVSGDVGSLVQRRRRMHMMCLAGGSTTLFNRLLWQMKPEPAGVLGTRIAGWLSGPVTAFFHALSTRRAVADFLESGGGQFGRILVEPSISTPPWALIAAIRGLDGDKAGALQAIEQWRARYPPGPAYSELAHRIDRIRERIVAL
jgi:hypothetical protein